MLCKIKNVDSNTAPVHAMKKYGEVQQGSSL
jgi:hypothetical protein